MSTDRTNIPNLKRDIGIFYDAAGKISEKPAKGTNRQDISTFSRKQFLALLAASAAFSAAGCSEYRDKGEIVPYNKKPPEITPGVPNFYASTCTGCAQLCGILIRTREGRPIKLEGNPEHPYNRGKICAKGQASVLDLYDPYRLRTPFFREPSGKKVKVNWKEADTEIIRRLRTAAREKREIAVITDQVSSPTAMKVLEDFHRAYPTVRFYYYSSCNDGTRRRAWETCYGQSGLPVILWDKARVILTLEADILGTEWNTIEQIRGFSAGRDILEPTNFNRLYCAEASMSLTGANSDYRLKLRPEAMLEFILLLLRETGAGAVEGVSTVEDFCTEHSVPPEVLKTLIADLKTNRGKAVAIAGNVLSEQVHIAVNYLNEALGALKIIAPGDIYEQLAPLSSADDFERLIGKMNDKEVAAVIHIDSNPVYNLPGEFGYSKALKAVPFSVSLTQTENETSVLCDYTLPINHMLESWGDHKVRTGIYGTQQPVIMPLYDTRQKEAALLVWAVGGQDYDETLYREYLKSRWEKEVYPVLGLKTDFSSFWNSVLHDGVLEYKESSKRRGAIKKSLLPKMNSATSEGYTIIVSESYYTADGCFANNGWLQELPHPVSKIVWDNYAAVSKRTASDLHVKNGDMIEIKSGGRSAILPVLIQYGQAEKVISTFLGYGRKYTGPIGNDVGVDINPFLAKKSLLGMRVYSGVSVRKTEGAYKLIAAQEEISPENSFTGGLQIKRKIIREGTLDEYVKNPASKRMEEEESPSIAAVVEYTGLKWGMAVDLNKCIGCNACLAGCIAENNVPVVGKEEVGAGRVMHWIRIDRYYSGTENDPVLEYQPMLCQHCDNAPCENVCPVVATNHSPDGLNQMVYNRCVGTKYCSNNCPFKVRKFNFFDWRNEFRNGFYEEQPVELVYNPDVTIRSRGVMEKCTFCIQRIMFARQGAIEKGTVLKGSDVRTACQEACPSSAIEFGDINDPNSKVSKYRRHDLAYTLLQETNVRSNITYLSRLRNKKTGI